MIFVGRRSQHRSNRSVCFATRRHLSRKRERWQEFIACATRKSDRRHFRQPRASSRFDFGVERPGARALPLGTFLTQRRKPCGRDTNFYAGGCPRAKLPPRRCTHQNALGNRGAGLDSGLLLFGNADILGARPLRPFADVVLDPLSFPQLFVAHTLQG